MQLDSHRTSSGATKSLKENSKVVAATISGLTVYNKPAQIDTYTSEANKRTKYCNDNWKCHRNIQN